METVNYTTSPFDSESRRSLWDYFKSCFTEKYATFTGRARRREYWGFYLWYTIFLVILEIPMLYQEESGDFGFFSILFFIFALAFFLPNLSVSVRRLHVSGKAVGGI